MELEEKNLPAESAAPPAREPQQVLKDLLESHRGERQVIVIQNYPDPDAIASAFAYKLICTAFNIEADIIHHGKISHHQNKALVALLGIQLISFDESMDLSQYSAAVFVDNQGTTCEEIVQDLEEANVPALVVIDHHEVQERLKPEFSDIRRTAGATSTILADYLESGDLIQLDKTNREHVLVATALFHGIMTDTGLFIRADTMDFHGAGFLSVFRDAELLELIMSQARSRQTMEVIHTAIGKRIIAENFSIAGVGYLRADSRDAIPQAADFLLTEENVHTAIVYGIVEDEREERVIGSLRTSKITIDPDEFLKDVFGKNAVGRYFGGGKMSAGGFEIPLGFLADGKAEALRDIKWQVFDQQIKQKIFTKIGFEAE